MAPHHARAAQVHRGAGLFDLRWILALLFIVYGGVLTVLGVGFTTEEDLAKAAGVAINLWAGLAMLLAAALFALWARLRPVVVDPRLIDHGDDDNP
ncbi:hypothetical protein FHR81_001286 [Actinoalloteichus hoggarensis]|uniref:Uncharacterized protein n=1 Tax=Actinoalloteichus hoggarensis TaxID=1470176 RepID=A0A221VZS8_9PSEU|nr:hypothetical protein [Actinoalloteichus hoggarensis]ASO19020.1 hypothetical protein AHOG_06860 [Actinoalloteichus hoggarensis]MBB5920256.1 hypothetical protein [Actinoalloteichus hoggarensis]